MGNSANGTVEEIEKSRAEVFKQTTYWKFITIGIVIILVILFAGMCYYQSSRFNSHVMINGTNVGGMTADQALKKLESASLSNKVYVGKDLIVNEKETNAGFTSKDLPGVDKLLKSQWTFFPSTKEKAYTLLPSNGNQYRSQTLKKLVEDKLTAMNNGLPAPKDAQVQLVQGTITISKSMGGKQLDAASLMKDYQKQEYNSEIHLNPVYIQPVKENSPIIKQEQKVLQDLLQRTVNYKVQDQVYSLKASDLIKNASVSKDMQVTFDTGDIKNKLAEINNSQATLNKTIQFKTHTGAVIPVKDQGYGWAINVDKETALIQQAFEKGQSTLSATNLYGNGWGNTPIGYQTSTNNGIGGTYAEVSIAEQKAYLYKNGQLVLSTNVVTGRQDVNEDTHPGVWYILYKKTPSILKGSEYGNLNYSVKVQYWAPFTNDGEGFHDASWRKNWSSTAYIHNGSGGCVNTPPSVMASVYANLSQYEPVIVY
jgi:hypothetical protein